MTMESKAGLLLAGVVVCLVIAAAAFGGYGWLQEHDARLKAETQTGEQQKQIEGLKQQQADAQRALAQKLASLEKEKKQPATAAELVRDVTGLLPGLPEPLQVEAAPANPALPDSPAASTVVVPQADFKSIRDAQITCEENTAKLTSCQAEQQEAGQQLKLTEDQRNEWKTEAKGGSLWHRALGAAKWFAVGAGTASVAYAVAHHR